MRGSVRPRLAPSFAVHEVAEKGQVAIDKPYLLWSAGIDGFFGPNIKVGQSQAEWDKQIANCDDVTNFK